MGSRLAALALALLAACSEPPITAGDAAIGAPDAAALLPDAALAPLSCRCDPDEDCPACFRHLGACCYDDETFGGAFDGIVAGCEGHPSCKACCNECVALSCDEIKARGSCPNILSGP